MNNLPFQGDREMHEKGTLKRGGICTQNGGARPGRHIFRCKFPFVNFEKEYELEIS